MREIKFRAWNKNNSDPKARMMELVHLTNLGLVIMPDGDTWDIPVMQYTNLKDKNGKEIYEGDCTQDKNVAIKGVDEFGEVIFKDGKFQLKMPMVGRDGYNYFDLVNYLNEHEIIGDIYENPELLK